MNFRVDVMVIGDSLAGHSVLDKLAKNNKIKIAFISQTFKSTTTHDYNNVKYFRDEVEYINYKYRLHCCYLKGGDVVFGTHLVLASGLTYEPLVVNGEQLHDCVFNNSDDIPAAAKDQTSLVICNNESDVKFAIDISKKYNKVYFCSKTLDLLDKVSAATSKKIEKLENINMINNVSINKATYNKDNKLQSVILDNYSEVGCSAIYVKTNSKPAINFVPKKLLSVDDDGYPVVTESCESTLVPKFFAAGNCLKKYTKNMEQKIVESILKDF